MTDTLSQIKDFVNYARSLRGDEKGEAQVLCDRLFQAFGHGGYKEAGAELEYRVKSKGKSTKFADLLWRPRLLLEMKKRGEKLERHYQQAFEYWFQLIPDHPQYVVLCNFDEFWIYDTNLQFEEPVERVALEELPERYNALNFLFPENKKLTLGANSHQRSRKCYENTPRSGVVEFVGREQELERLHQLLQQQDGLAIAAIVGMGGVGKTELAIQYTRQHLQRLADDSGGVYWIDARDGDVGVQLVRFARSQLAVNPPEDLDLVSQVKFCWQYWQAGDALVVIDDVTNYRQQVKPYLPPETSRFKVLLAMREKLGSSLAYLPIYELQPEAALKLLGSLVDTKRMQSESEIAAQLCQWLGYLPLGLELVGRYP